MRAMAGFVAGSPLVRGQQDVFRDHTRVAGLNELVTSFDFEAVAFAKVPRAAYDYTAYGSDSEFTLRRNREAFDWVELVPRGVADVTKPQTATEILGTPMAYPIFVSPSANHEALHPQGEMATHIGATAANTPYIISQNTTFPVEKVAAAAKGPIWFQLYPRQEIEDNRPVLEAAQAAGAKAIVVTIDQQAAVYERALHDRSLGVAMVGRNAPRRPAASANPYRISDGRLWYDWKYFDQIRPMVKVPILAKGVLTAEDAKLCLEHGLDGIYVSNHGGRSLDYGPSTLEVLPEIVEAVRGRVPMLFDSGIRRGTDILKALALGANAVCLGRVPRWGLAAYGAEGVQRVIEIMQKELVQAMLFTGRPTLASIDRTLVRTDFA
jgi:isopentenyl diphosphate isomerase/L-lactate dehydrogenase-like FMN-dependent dehydrogenase